MHVQVLWRSFDFIFLPDYVQHPANCAARRPLQAILFLRHDMSSISGKHLVHLLQTQQKFDCCIYAYWNAYELIVVFFADRWRQAKASKRNWKTQPLQPEKMARISARLRGWASRNATIATNKMLESEQSPHRMVGQHLVEQLFWLQRPG